MTRIRTTRMHKGLACLLMLLSIVYVSVQGAEQSPIAAAAKANNLTTVRALIAKGTDVNAPQADGSTALLWAAYNGNARDDARPSLPRAPRSTRRTSTA